MHSTPKSMKGRGVTGASRIAGPGEVVNPKKGVPASLQKGGVFRKNLLNITGNHFRPFEKNIRVFAGKLQENLSQATEAPRQVKFESANDEIL